MVNRIQLAQLPTPIEALPHLSKLLGGPQLFIKRDEAAKPLSALARCSPTTAARWPQQQPGLD